MLSCASTSQIHRIQIHMGTQETKAFEVRRTKPTAITPTHGHRRKSLDMGPRRQVTNLGRERILQKSSHVMPIRSIHRLQTSKSQSGTNTCLRICRIKPQRHVFTSKCRTSHDRECGTHRLDHEGHHKSLHDQMR